MPLFPMALKSRSNCSKVVSQPIDIWQKLKFFDKFLFFFFLDFIFRCLPSILPMITILFPEVFVLACWTSFPILGRLQGKYNFILSPPLFANGGYIFNDFYRVNFSWEEHSEKTRTWFIISPLSPHSTNLLECYNPQKWQHSLQPANKLSTIWLYVPIITVWEYESWMTRFGL